MNKHICRLPVYDPEEELEYFVDIYYNSMNPPIFRYYSSVELSEDAILRMKVTMANYLSQEATYTDAYDNYDSITFKYDGVIGNLEKKLIEPSKITDIPAIPPDDPEKLKQWWRFLER